MKEHITNKRIVVTGGAGFIGSSLIKRIIDKNQVTVLDNFSRDALSKSEVAKHPNLTIKKGDVLDRETVVEVTKGADIIVHAAAIAGIDTVIKSPTQTMRVNMFGVANILEAAQINKTKDRVVVFSTSEVFGSNAFKPTEDSDTVSGSAGEARWTYAVSKLAGEHLALAYFKQFGVPIVGVRPFNIYGPGQIGEGAIRTFVRRALNDEDLKINGDGSQIRAWCYIDDFLDCLLMCISDPKAVGETFNIGNARTVLTTFGLAQTVCRVLNSKSKIVFIPKLSADVELRIPSVEKARAVLGFEAKVDIDEGIRTMAAWVQNSAKA